MGLCIFAECRKQIYCGCVEVVTIWMNLNFKTETLFILICCESASQTQYVLRGSMYWGRGVAGSAVLSDIFTNTRRF